MEKPLYIVPPSIDPLSEKNVPLSNEEINGVRATYDIDPGRPVICQVSRFDRFKDPVGVIEVYRMTEALWKGKPVIGGNVSGIRIQVLNHTTGFLVNSPEGAALRIRYLLTHTHRMAAMGKNAKAFVAENYLLTRHLREYLALMVAVISGSRNRIELSCGI
jgi:glycosyltransferase involved in cell wall biosynthesis